MGDNILGKSFKDFVIKQIDYRQEVLARVDRGEEFLKYVSKTPWLRMASSVDIYDPIKAGQLNLPLGKEAAETFVLQGGITTVLDTSGKDEDPYYEPQFKRRGVSPNNNIINDNSYGFGNSDQGKTPMPGLTSIDVQNYNNGAVRKGVVKFTCTSLEQFNIINTLYMRVGYYTLVEWGHCTYLDSENKEIINRQEFNTPAFSKFFEGKTSATILGEIQREVVSSNGNYDALIGKVTNFSWTFRDGSYDCSVDIFSPGDIIDSLRANVTSISKPVQIKKSKIPDGTEFVQTGLGLNAGVSVFTGDTEFSNDTNGAESDTSDTEDQEKDDQKIKPLFIKESDSSVIASTLYYFANQLDNNGTYLSKTTRSYKTPGEKNAKVEVYRFTDGSETKSYFITLGRLLKMIENKILLYDPASKEPIIRINSDYNDNYCARFPEQVSTDYSKCFIPYNLELEDKSSVRSQRLYEAYNSTDEDVKGKDARFDYKNYVGKMMHLLINFDFIIDTLLNKTNKDNKISIKDFLQTLMDGVSSAIGGINDFKIGYSYLKNELTIYDNNPLVTDQLVKGIKPKIAKFNSYGVQKDKSASFLRNVSIQSSISNNLATQIAVGGQSDGNQIGENATAFSLFNAGLEDRIQPSSVDAYHTNNSGSTDPSIVFKENKQKLFKLVKQRSGKTASEIDLASATAINTNYAKYYLGQVTKVEKTPGSIFIPFDMTLEMDGLSGTRIFDIFSIDNKILPEMYTDSLNFIISGIQHNVTLGGWTSTISSFTFNQFEATDPQPLSTIKTYEESNSNSNATLSGRYFNPNANNPYNIRPIGTAKNFNGVIGDKEGFQGDKPIGLFLVFDELDNGIRAGMKNLVNGYFKRGINTVDKIINRYAPSSDGNNTNSYITNVVNYMNTNLKGNLSKGSAYTNITKDTILTFSGFDESNPDNKLVFKALNLGILSSEGSINQIPNLISAVEKFSISKLKSTA